MNVNYLDDDEIREWLLNDEGLYNWLQGSKMGMRKFIATYKAEILECIDNVVNAKSTRSYY